MPRDGSHQYHVPPGTQGIPDTTVASTPYNAFLADLEADLNLPRPIEVGGSGASSADGALDNLSAEKFKMVVTNWDTNVWRAGSFYATTAATGISPIGTVPPTTAHAFAGIAYYANATDFVVEALDLTTGIKYVRYMTGGVWGAWTATNASQFVLKAGDTMTGDLTVSKANAELILNRPDATTNVSIQGQKAGLARWRLDFGNLGTEPGANVGSDFVLTRYNDAGVAIFGDAINVSRFDGLMRVTGDPTALLGVATKQYVDTGLANTVKISAQALTDPQQQQARQNIYAAPFDAMSFNGMQYNGSMDVAQFYGAGFSSAAWENFTGYAIDGWISNIGPTGISPGAFTVAHAAPPGAPGFGGALQSCLKVTSTTAAAYSATAQASLIHYIEGYRFQRMGMGQASAQPVSIGFWVYATISGTATVLLGSYGSASRAFIREFAVVGGAWTYVPLTFPPDTSGAANWLVTNGKGASLTFCFGGGTTTKGGTKDVWASWTTQYSTGNLTNFYASNNNVVALTGLVVLPGNETPSALKHPLIMRPYENELMLSKRYLQVHNQNDYLALYGYNIASATPQHVFTRDVEMRLANPTASLTGTWAVSNCSQPVSAASNAKAFTLYTTVTATNVYAATFAAGVKLSYDARL